MFLRNRREIVQLSIIRIMALHITYRCVHISRHFIGKLIQGSPFVDDGYPRR